MLYAVGHGNEAEAIATFQQGTFRPEPIEHKAFIQMLIDIKAYDLASSVALTVYNEDKNTLDNIACAARSELYCQRPDHAIKIVSDATNLLGPTPSLHLIVGLAMMSVGSLENAGSAIQAAQQMKAEPIGFAYLGEVLRLMGRIDDAITCHEKCLTAGCTDAEAFLLAGNAYYDADQIDTALLHYEKAVVLKRHYVDAHDTLNKALWEHGRHANFLKSFDNAIDKLPALLILRLRQAYFRILAGKLDDAAAQLEDCLETFGPNARVYAELAGVKKQLDTGFDALPLYAKAYDLDATDTNMLKAYGRNLIGARQYERAADILTECKAIDSADQECLAFLSAAHSHVKPADAARVNDYEGLVQAFEPSPPAEYASLQDFNAALLRALQPYHRSEAAPLDQTLVRGTQTHGMLFNNKNKEIRQLEEMLRVCIKEYITHLKQVGPAEIKSRISDGFEFSGAWSVQLSEGGYHLDHVHSSGWISSVYYVEVPDDLDENAHEGWLKFGDMHFDPNNTGPHRFIKPVPGRLVLFPSYMLHGTVPIQKGKRRTTVAFDVVPN